MDSGCTAVVALIHERRHLYVANSGDSRCVLCRNGTAVDMSIDHKPEDDIESTRIQKAGGRVTCDGRVNGGLNLSRAIGMLHRKNCMNLSAGIAMSLSLKNFAVVGHYAFYLECSERAADSDEPFIFRSDC